jgi:SAM-dependent methyltransferase
MTLQQQTIPLAGAAVRGTENYRGDHLLVAQMVERGSKVLDVGCGEGDLLQLLESRGIDGRGIELSREGVNRCVAKGLAVVQGDADTDLINYPDDAFDYVILSQTLQATRQPRVVLENLTRRTSISAPSRISCSSATRSTSRWSARSRSISTAARCGSTRRGGSGTCSASRACSCSAAPGRRSRAYFPSPIGRGRREASGEGIRSIVRP